MSQASPLFTAFTSAASLYPVIEGERAKKQQKAALRAQEDAQRQATARAASEQRRQGMEQRRLNRKTPDVSALLSQERRASRTGPGATTLTGASGVGRSRLTLGSASLLGEA